MGWSSRNDNFKNEDEFFNNEFADELSSGRIMDYDIIPRDIVEWGANFKVREYEAYCAMKSERETVFGAVVLLHHDECQGNSGWSYKMISEHALPAAARCPARILDILDPPETENASEWRNNCRMEAKSAPRM